MTITRDLRARITWVLFTCILLNAFVCSLNHATHVGFELAIGQQAFCSSDDRNAGAAGLAAEHYELPLDCPLCSLVFLTIVALAALGWLRRHARVPRTASTTEPHGPRHHWPALNPRGP